MNNDPKKMTNQSKKKEYIIMDKESGHVVYEGENRRPGIPMIWSWLGFTAPDFFKMAFYCTIAIYYGTRFYIQNEQTQNFISTQTAINAHLTQCSDNRDKWATAKYGHSFSCGKPDDGWSPNMGNLPK